MDRSSSGPVNKPGGSSFKQQKLPAWKPVFTAQCVIPLFFAFGLVFVPIGVVLFLESDKVREMSIDYSNCMSTDGNSTCSDLRRQNRTLDSMAIPCICNQQFTISEDWTGTVYVYYRLTEFYQNHRRYLKSVNQEQLQGSTSKTSGCTPNAFTSTDDVPILPCGMIANSKFNDTFSLYAIPNGTDRMEIELFRNKTAWTEDIKYKFGNPTSFAGTARPAFWQQNVSSLPGMLENEDLAVWMRAAALPKFRKLWARIPGGLQSGNYSFTIGYNFPIRRGEKNIVISTVSWIGGRNHFLAYAYLVVGGLSLLGGVALIIVYTIWGRTKKDLSQLQ